MRPARPAVMVNSKLQVERQANCFATMWATLAAIALRLWKVILHFLTRKSEIERICSAGEFSAEMAIEFDRALHASKQLKSVVVELQKKFDGNLLEFADRIASIKKISKTKESWSVRVQPNLVQCLNSLASIYRLLAFFLAQCAEKYDTENAQHERELEELWELLRPGVRRTGRLTEEWGEIGFQGVDPATDFRGMGMMGLRNLTYFARNRSSEATRLLRDVVGWRAGYPFAVCGINITGLLLDLLRQRRLQVMLHRRMADPETLHDIYCALFVLFHDFYLNAKPKDVMQYGPIMKDFREKRLVILEQDKLFAERKRIVDKWD